MEFVGNGSRFSFDRLDGGLFVTVRVFRVQLFRPQPGMNPMSLFSFRAFSISLILLQAVATTPAGSAEPEVLSYEKVYGVGPTQAVEAVGNRLYAAGRGVFHVLDSSDPAKPRLLGKVEGLGNTRQIFVDGTTAYVTARQDGLWLIDVSDPAKPTVISHYDTVEMATGIWVSGQVAFVATRQYGVELIDVSDPRKPRHLSALKTGEAQSCWGRDGLLYIGDWAPKKMIVADVRDPRNPKIIGEAELDGYGDGGCLRDNLCYAATGHHSRLADKEAAHGKGHGLEIFDVSQPGSPVFLSRVKFPAYHKIYFDMWSARVAGDHCVVADTWNGLFVVNVSDPKRAKIVARAELPKIPEEGESDPVGGVALGEGVIYAAGIYTGLYVVKAPGMAVPAQREPDAGVKVVEQTVEPAAPEGFAVYRPEGQVRSVTVVDDVAWAACGIAGIQAVRLGDAPSLIAQTPGKGVVFHVAVAGDRLYAAENNAGLGIYRIEPSMQLTEIGRLVVPGYNIKQVACPPPGRFALFHCGGATAFVADVSDPAAPKVVLRDPQVGLFYGDQLVPEMLGGRYLVAFWQRSGPAWYDVSGEKPVHLGNTPDERMYSFANGACLLKDKLLVVQRNKLYWIEPGEMRDLQTLPTYEAPGRQFAGRPTTDGRQLALSRRPNRQVQVYDISDLQTPRFLREYELPGHPGACGFWQGRLVIPAGYTGLLVERSAP